MVTAEICGDIIVNYGGGAFVWKSVDEAVGQLSESLWIDSYDGIEVMRDGLHVATLIDLDS